MTLQNSRDPRQATPGDDYRRDAPLNAELQADPELREGPAGPGRIAIYAVAIAILLGAVFFGLNSNPTTTATNPPPAATATNSPTPSSATPAVRDVTPNREAGTTTGAAPSQSTQTPATPAQPIQAPQANPSGTQVDQNKGPANN